MSESSEVQPPPAATNENVANGALLFQPMEITDHLVDGGAAPVRVLVLDKRGAGNASHRYRLEWAAQTIDPPGGAHAGGNALEITFQNGPIKEAGQNGVTNEALLSVLIDRMRGFQAGPYACGENANALRHLADALGWLLARTKARIDRGVEGTHAK